MKNTKNQAKILQSCFLQIAISQDWIGGFLISQRLWVRKACGQILKLRWFHNSCKQSFYVTKTPKTHLRLYSHSAVTVCAICVSDRSSVHTQSVIKWNFCISRHHIFLSCIRRQTLSSRFKTLVGAVGKMLSKKKSRMT